MTLSPLEWRWFQLKLILNFFVHLKFCHDSWIRAKSNGDSDKFFHIFFFHYNFISICFTFQCKLKSFNTQILFMFLKYFFFHSTLFSTRYAVALKLCMVFFIFNIIMIIQHRMIKAMDESGMLTRNSWVKMDGSSWVTNR